MTLNATNRSLKSEVRSLLNAIVPGPALPLPLSALRLSALPACLPPHFHGNVHRDFTVQLEGHRVLAEFLDRLAQPELAAVRLEAKAAELFGNIRGGDGAIQGLRLADFAPDNHF